MESQENFQKKCLNCGHDLPKGASYCPACSQKVTTGKVSIKDFFFEFLDALFSLDSRVWRTLRDIWIPGKLTTEYFKGKHKTYMHPLRLFFILALIHFAIISYRTGAVVTQNLTEGHKYLRQEQIESDFFKKIDSLGNVVQEDFNNQPLVVAAIDTLLLLSNERVDTFSTENDFIFPSVKNKKGENIQIAFSDYYKYTYEELRDRYEITGFFPQMFLKQQYRAANNPDQMYQSFMANLIWMILLMMPALALVLKILYIRKGSFFIEHLVFSFHFHAFAFLLVSPFYFFLSEGSLANILIPFAVIIIYLLLMMKRYYLQGWFKTVFKWLTLLTSYLFIVILFLLGALVFSFFMF